jgi:hypothetical protein
VPCAGADVIDEYVAFLIKKDRAIPPSDAEGAEHVA